MAYVLTVHRFAYLVCHPPDVLKTEGQKTVFLNEVICTKSQQFKHNADMAMMFKPFQHLDTATANTIRAFTRYYKRRLWGAN